MALHDDPGRDRNPLSSFSLPADSSVIAARRRARAHGANVADRLFKTIAVVWQFSVLIEARLCGSQPVARASHGAAQLNQLEEFHPGPRVVAERSHHGAGDGE